MTIRNFKNKSHFTVKVPELIEESEIVIKLFLKFKILKNFTLRFFHFFSHRFR